MRLLSVRPALALAVVVTATACGTLVDATHDPGAGGPTDLGPAADRSPRGTERVVCRLDRGGEPVRFALDLPDDVRAGRANGQQCIWAHTERVKGYVGGYRVTITVSSANAEERTLQEQYDEDEPYAVEDGEFEGDETIFDLELDDDVPVFGDTVGQRFSVHCFCDGQDPIVRAFEADGVRVTWVAHADLTSETDREIERALAGAGLAS